MRHTVLISRRHSLAGWVVLLVCSVGPGHAQEKWNLAGRVVDEKGNPVAGAEVCLDAYSRGTVVAETGSDGRFRLDELQTETVKILVAADGKSPTLTKLKAGEITGEADFPLQPGHVLKVRVIDSTGNPIEGVRVCGDDWRDSALLVRFTTDKEGRVEWSSAPSDPVEYMFQKPGFCRLVNEEILADGNERVIRLWKPLRIDGHVTNAVTGRPIDDFAVIPVLRLNSGLLVAQRARSTEGHAGRFFVVVDRPDAGHVVRIEAKGYRAAMTGSYRVEQGDQECVVRLEPAPPVRGIVRDSKGDPAVAAHVYLATASQHLKFYPREDDDNFWILSGQDGLFEFPAQCERYSLVAIDERGYAEVTCEQNEQPGCMTLRPWARIKGVLLQSGQPVGDESVYLTSRRFTGRDSPRVNDRMRATTDGKGRFAFPRVPPIPCKVMADLSIWDDSALSSSQSVPLDLKPGLTIWVNLGAAGADVTGRAVLENRTDGQLDLSYSLNYLLRMQPAAQSPAHVAEGGFDWRNGWNDIWKSTPEGRSYRDSLHYYSVKLKPDGTFLISGVPVGEYELALNIYESPEGGCLVNPIGARKFRFRVPSDVYESSDGILNLGSIPVKPVDAPRPGNLVPNFGFETADGRKVQLTDFRGKYVLLDFWATWCGPCIAQVPSVKQIHDRFGDAGQLVVVGLNLDQDKEKAKQLVRRHAIDWPQGYLGDWTETNVPQQLGVGSIPMFLLIDPNGTLVHKSRQADDMAEAINRLLLSDP